MKVAYIAGPYRAKSLRGVIDNIRAAEKVAMKYWNLGYAVICPHMNCALFDGTAPDEVWLEGDKELLRRSDVIVMLPTWRKSSGARAEHDLAKELSKEIIYEDPLTSVIPVEIVTFRGTETVVVARGSISRDEFEENCPGTILSVCPDGVLRISNFLWERLTDGIKESFLMKFNATEAA